MTNSVKSAARDAEDVTPLRWLARGGYVANGVVHLLVGVIALVIAWRGRGESDQAGALAAIAALPLGFVALWLIAGLLAALGVYHAIHGVALRIANRRKRWGRRVAELGQAGVFLAMGGFAAYVALGARPDPDQSVQHASRVVLAIPGGWLLLGGVGLGIGIGGIAWIVMGIRRSYRKQIDLPDGVAGHAISALGVAGFIAKGAALVVVGALILAAALQHDPELAGGLDDAIQSIRALPFGNVMVGIIGAGFLLFGIFCMFRARYARMQE